MTLTTVNAGMLDTQAQYNGFKNRIINGQMVLDQRNAGASVTPTDGTYTIDRWQYSVSQTSKLTAQQSSTAATGFIKSLLTTSSSAYSIVAADYFMINQRVEGLNVFDLGWGAAGAATVTLSFWVRSSLTGTFGGAINNAANDRSYPFTYTISVANTYEYKTITIAGDTGGTWLTTNGVGMTIRFGLGVGSTYSGTAGAWAAAGYFSATGATSVVGTNGATFYITGVQLEKGSTATSFDYRPYGTELALCQRYYVKYSSSGASNQAFLIGVVGNSTTGQMCGTNFANPMRTSPTGSSSGGTTLRIFDGSGAPVITSLSAQSSSITTASLDFIASGAGLTTGRPALIIPNGVSCYVDFSAEL